MQTQLDLEAQFTFHYGPIQIQLARANLYNSFLFTFHYGPIQIVINPIVPVSLFQFTFHYGPIQIRCYCNTIIV